jgi:hypothetical protein
MLSIIGDGFVGLFQDNGEYEKGWVLGTFDGSFSFALTTGSKMNYLKASGVAINPGEWYHIAGTYDGMTQKIYINGELKSSATLGGEISYPPTDGFRLAHTKTITKISGTTVAFRMLSSGKEPFLLKKLKNSTIKSCRRM